MKTDDQIPVELANGVMLPRIGLGVFQASSGETRLAVQSALKLGYRHIDTARIYRNESDVGFAIAESGVARGEIFVTTKLWNTDQGYDSALRAFDTSRKALNLDVIDLYLLHWPVQGLRKESWRALEELYDQGAIRAIGVSNFMVHHLEEMRSYAKTMPMVNQIEIHPYLQQRDVRQWCANHGIAVEAYSPLGRAVLLNDRTVLSIAKEINTTAAQVVLAWALSKGLVVLPKSVHENRQAENFAAANVILSQHYISQIDKLEHGTTTGWDPRQAP